jgi:hypothetical protein
MPTRAPTAPLRTARTKRAGTKPTVDGSFMQAMIFGGLRDSNAFLLYSAHRQGLASCRRIRTIVLLSMDNTQIRNGTGQSPQV